MLKITELPQDHFSSSCDAGERCPVRAVHRRLQEAHRFWHTAADSYHDPDAFSSHLNATIQALRNVTFILQSQKSEISDFDSWYAPWQERFKNDPLMRWLNDARTQVVHQDDLQTLSTVRCKVLTGWHEPPVFETQVSPLIPTRAIAWQIASSAKLSKRAREEGVVSVERRWVEKNLPEHEILDVLAHSYSVLKTAVDHLHLPPSARGLAVDEQTAHVECMAATETTRTAYVSILTGHEKVLEETKLDPPPDMTHEAVESRYRFSEIQGGASPASSLREKAMHVYEMAKRIIEKDGYHSPVVLYFTADNKIAIHTLTLEDRAELLVSWRVVAANVKKTRAVAIISIGEAWIAPVPPDGIVRTPARESPDRVEILQVHAIASTGEEHSFFSEKKRKWLRTRLGPVKEFTSQQTFYLEPVREVWRAVPDRS